MVLTGILAFPVIKDLHKSPSEEKSYTSINGQSITDTSSNAPYELAASLKRETYKADDTNHVNLLYSTSNNMIFAVLLSYKPISNTIEAFADDHFMQSVEQPVEIQMYANNLGVISWNAYDTNVTTFTIRYFADYRETNLLRTVTGVKYTPSN